MSSLVSILETVKLNVGFLVGSSSLEHFAGVACDFLASLVSPTPILSPSAPVTLLPEGYFYNTKLPGLLVYLGHLKISLCFYKFTPVSLERHRPCITDTLLLLGPHLSF